MKTQCCQGKWYGEVVNLLILVVIIMRVKRILVTLIQDDITQIMCIYGRANRDESHEKKKKV